MNLSQPKNIVLTLFFTTSLFLTLMTTNAQAVDGVCGSANGQTFPTAPATNLCSSGSASAVTGSGPWNWNCIGSDNPNCTEGESKTCTTSDSCAGKQYCTNGNWGACTKNDANCGSNDYCSKGQWCDGDTGSCVDKCSQCPCPTDKPTCGGDGKCSAAGGVCEPITQFQLPDGTCASGFCDDGTLKNQCSANGELCMVNSAGTAMELKPSCPTCPCPGGKSCQNGTCESNGLPESFSWVDKGKITPGKHQGSCGSCWAFAAVAAVEAMHAIETGNFVDLSEQEMLSCNVGTCDGGWPGSVTYYARTKGISMESCIPYEGQERHEICDQRDKCLEKVGYGTYRGIGTMDEMLKYIYEVGPVPIIVNDGKHAVLAVGWTGGNFYIKDSATGQINGQYPISGVSGASQ